MCTLSDAYTLPEAYDYSDKNGIIDYNRDVNTQLYELFGIDEKNQLHIHNVLALKGNI